MSLYFIKANSIRNARFEAVKLIMEKGRLFKDQRSEQTKYIKNLIILIDVENCEVSDNPLTARCGAMFGENLITGENPRPEVEAIDSDVQDPEYSYGAEAHTNNMVEKIIEQIRTNPESRRLVLPLFKPAHVGGIEIPCMITIVFDIEDDFLNLTIFGRSNDEVIAMQSDIKGFEIFLRWMAWRTGYDAGTILLHVVNAHCRVNSDMDEIKRILKEGAANLTPSNVPTSLIRKAKYHWQGTTNLTPSKLPIYMDENKQILKEGSA